MSKCCKSSCARTPSTFISKNLSKSKLPRWCGNEVPLIDDPLEACFGIPDSLFNPDGTLKSVCEPPPLTETELKAIWALKSLKKEVDDRVKETAGHTDYLKGRLRDVKREIETISSKLENPTLDQCQAGITEEDRKALLVEFAKENLRLQRDLLENIDLEKKFTDELTQAQRDQWKAVTDKELVTVEEEKVKPTLSYYQKQRSFKVQKRTMNEKRIRQNALKIRNRTLDKVVKSLHTTYVESKQKAESATAAKLQTAKISRWRVQAYLKKTMGSQHQQKVHAACTQQYRQDRQYQMLSKLKKEIASQRSHLIATHQAKERKRAEDAMKDEVVHAYIEMTGTNPYVVEHLVAMEKRYNEQRKKIIEKEHERLTQLHRDFEIIEKSTQREEMRKKKWEGIWAKRFEERKKAERTKKMEFLYSGPLPTDEQDEAKAGKIPRPATTQLHDGEHALLEVPNGKQKMKLQIALSESEKNAMPEDDKTATSGSNKKYQHNWLKKRFVRKSTESIAGEVLGEDDILSGSPSKRTSQLDEVKPILPSAEVKKEKINKKPFKFRYTPKPKAKPIGPFFKWTPETIVFSDYEVGRTYRQNVTVTNISIQRMKFFVKELLDDMDYSEPNDLPKLQDMIKVKFAVSKLLSPGLTHDVALLFTPKVLTSWKGTLYFQSNEDPFQIRIECLQQRFLPSLSSNQITFTDTVVNTAGVLPVIIKNSGSKRGVITRIFQKVVQIYEELLLTENEEENEEDKISLGSFAISDAPSALLTVSATNTVVDDVSTPTPSKIPSSTKPKKKRPSKSKSNTASVEESKSGNSSRKGTHIAPSKSKKKVAKKERSNSQNRIKRSKQSSVMPIRHVQVKPNDSLIDCRAILSDLIFTVTQDVFSAYVKECNRKLDREKTRKICVLFRPPYLGSFKTTFEIEFEDEAIPNMTFDVVGNSVPNPISIEPANTDMRICFLGHNYQQMLSVTTTSKGAGKVIPLLPPQLKPYVKVVPTQATVFPKSPANFCVKFQPSAGMMEQNNPISKYFDRETKLIDFPVYFQLKFPYKMDSPLTTTFLAVVTDHQLEFLPEELNMGKCCSNESVQASFLVYNNSFLPQHIGFVDCPEFISIQPNFGFATLLPFEKKEFQLILSLPDGVEGDITYNLKCQSRERKKSVLKVTVNAKVNHIHLSHSRIMFPVTPIGSLSTATIELFSNAGPDLQNGDNPPKTKFQFLIPPNSPIEILPKAGYITFEQSQRLLVRFKPSVSDEQVKLHAIEMLENQHIHAQGLLQRELDGIIQALDTMVGGEDDLYNEMLGDHYGTDNMMSSQSIDLGDAILSSVYPIDKTMSSFIQAAPAPSDIKLILEKKRRTIGIPKEPLSEHEVKLERKKTGPRKSTRKSRMKISDKSARNSVASSLASGSKKKKSLQIPIPLQVVSEEQKIFRELHARREELVLQLANPYELPSPDDIAVSTKEFVKAKRDYLKKVRTSCTALKIPCFITHTNGETDILMLYCKCPISQPSFILMEDSPVVDFASMVLGSVAHKELHFHNISQGTLKIRLNSFNPFGPFTQCNAARLIPPNYVYTLRLRFQPNCTDLITETIRVSIGESKESITLIGEGEIPEFTIAPAGADYYLGNVDIGQFLFQEFAIHNANKARLKFTMKLIDHGECDVSTEEGRRKSEYFSDEYIHVASDLRNSITNEWLADEEEKEEEMRRSKSNPPPPTPDPKYIKPLGRKASRKSADSVHPPLNVARKSKRSSRGSKGSEIRTLSDVMSPPEPEMIFEIDSSDETKMSLNTKDLVQHLIQNNEKYYFCTDPPVLPIPGGKTRLFRVYFVPARQGQFYSHFEMALEGKPIQEFNVYGTGHEVHKPKRKGTTTLRENEE